MATAFLLQQLNIESCEYNTSAVTLDYNAAMHWVGSNKSSIEGVTYRLRRMTRMTMLDSHNVS